jgi:uncharacterized protein (DUF1800 family)
MLMRAVLRRFAIRRFAVPTLLVSGALACAPAFQRPTPVPNNQGPLDDAARARQAVSRLTFGARPSDVAEAQRMGVDHWIDRQLHPETIPDPVADSVLDRLEITHKTAFELAADHPQPAEFGLALAAQTARDSAAMRATMASIESAPASVQLAAMRAQAEATNERAERGQRLSLARNAVQRELVPSLIIRAELSERQLLEVMTDFWENHFSVNGENTFSPLSLVDYDHAIRARALGKFRDLLGAVAKSPAMLYYLDNYQSVVDSLHPNPTEWALEQRRAAHPPLGDTSLVHGIHRRRVGINENYARELMELHTLGVDGGYTQHDVQEVARCLTGWGFDDIQYGGQFAFHEALHDAGEKVVLGVRIPGGRGIEDGEEVLDILARNPSTARFIARKLVVHFVSDSAPPALVDRAAETFRRTDGDIREVLRTILRSAEFDSRAAYRAKVKTPFELVASILRVMNAAPDTTRATSQLVAQLGQPILGRATPDGWPDQAAAWMNTGALMNRINLGVRVGANQIAEATLTGWKPRQQIDALDGEQQVDAVVESVLGGDASAETRRAMLAVQSPPHSLRRVGDLLAVAIGSSDFQRR